MKNIKDLKKMRDKFLDNVFETRAIYAILLEKEIITQEEFDAKIEQVKQQFDENNSI